MLRGPKWRMHGARREVHLHRRDRPKRHDDNCFARGRVDAESGEQFGAKRKTFGAAAAKLPGFFRVRQPPRRNLVRAPQSTTRPSSAGVVFGFQTLPLALPGRCAGRRQGATRAKAPPRARNCKCTPFRAFVEFTEDNVFRGNHIFAEFFFLHSISVRHFEATRNVEANLKFHF